MRELFSAVSRNLISFVGALLTTISALVFFALFAVHLAGFEGGPYIGILSFVLVPSIFIVGLLLMPVGLWLQRRRDRARAAQGLPPTSAPVIDFNQPATRRMALVVAGLTVVNLSVVAAATYKSVEVMDSPQFCGQTCHTVMAPEYSTYQRSPHARVKCTECHIGSGASWFVKSKISGSWQLVSVALKLFPKPIPTPVHNLRPSRDTCEQCHWPTKFIGERLKVRSHFADDEKSTEKKNVFLLKVGGIQDGKGKGIHWHVDPRIQIRYRADAKREKIFEVEKNEAGVQKVFKPEEGGTGTGEWRTMDCIDCHNRPTHVYRYPDEAMDKALESGDLDKTLPFVNREGLRLIQEKYASHEDARTKIQQGLREFYAKSYPDLAKTDGARIDKAAEALFTLYSQNVFPQMNVTWGSYPNFTHEHVGCFRCHDNKHVAEDGKKIKKGCDMCHTMLATGEEKPEVLDVLFP